MMNARMKIVLVRPFEGDKELWINIERNYVRRLSPPDALKDDFDSCINKFKERDKRKEFLKRTAEKLVLSMLERIEDEEGWNGAHREEMAIMEKSKGPMG